MCGIIGYIGDNSSVEVLISGLKRLEYRGYDSAGIAFRNGSGIEIFKTQGKISDLQRILPDPLPTFTSGVGHTRWATHGEPSSANAHPHEANGIAVVHNGIIENYREIKASLKESGRTFSSATDTEVIPHMIARYANNGSNILDSLKQTLSYLKGSYALGILCSQCPDAVFAVRRGSPLVIGLGERKNYFASDVAAILPFTRRFIFLEDDQLCTLTKDRIEIIDVKTGAFLPVEDLARDIDWSPTIAEKSGFDHFMLKEIHEQPHAIENTICEWIESPRDLFEELGMDTKLVLDLRKLHIVACGTSYHAALIGKYLIESIARVPVDVDIASEYRYKRPIVESGTLCVAITQSGETADTLAAQREAKKRGAKTLTISNVVGSTSTREADFALYTRAGLEIGVAATKTFTAQMSALSLLALFLGTKKGRLTQEEKTAFKTFLCKIPNLLEIVIENGFVIRRIAEAVGSAHAFLYLGRGINFPIALEGALKMKEISYVHAEGYAAGEMKHGPIALIEKGMPVVVLASADNLFEKTVSNIEEVKARGARVIAVTNEPSYLKDKVDELIPVPATHPALSPFVNVVPLQLLAYHLGVLRGCNVDQPRNLAKSVTVE